jgi:CHASE2 domain-containing sensor protein
MTQHTECGRLFIALGVLLVIVGLALYSHLRVLSPWPPFLIPALLSLMYGAYCLWRQKHPLD